MNITKIVITGGPCAGKTTGLKFLEKSLSNLGYKVVLINECATEIILSGLDPTAFQTNLDFERNIISLQVAKEKLYTQYCEKLPYEDVILICDRGVMDCQSYMTKREFNQVLREFKLNKRQLMTNYDAVFHLVTAAKGAENAYTKTNNCARRESLAEAKTSDSRTMKAWLSHPYFKLIDNSTNFENKIHRLVNEICSFLKNKKVTKTCNK